MPKPKLKNSELQPLRCIQVGTKRKEGVDIFSVHEPDMTARLGLISPSGQHFGEAQFWADEGARIDHQRCMEIGKFIANINKRGRP